MYKTGNFFKIIDYQLQEYEIYILAMTSPRRVKLINLRSGESWKWEETYVHDPENITYEELMEVFKSNLDRINIVRVNKVISLTGDNLVKGLELWPLYNEVISQSN